MLRLKYFLAEFIFCLLAFIVFNSVTLIDTLLFVVFALSAFFYVFAFEELPKSSLMVYPDIHYYQKSRINLYAYLMVGQLALLSFAYYLLTLYLNFRFGVIILILWFLMIVFTYFITHYTQKTIFVDAVSDYIFRNVKTGLTLVQVKMAVSLIYDNTYSKKEIDDDKLLKILSNKLHVNSGSLLAVINSYNNYLLVTANSLISPEIEEANKMPEKI